ncbi:uroporphyrinogen-III C-methyltransferase [Nitrospira defluvii]|nr:uroporphyrinogen-III C-methyltransferase [Nitrospira defluvii]
MSTYKKIGTVYLVGAGPGDPKLITLRGKELLEIADTVIYDYLANPKLLDYAKERAEKLYVGKKGGSRSSKHQEKINRLMIDSAEKGKTVVRLKGGDPFIFGRGGEEVEALSAASIPFEVIPGITSAIGVPTYAGIPLTHRELASSVTFITGHEDPDKKEDQHKWAQLATGADTLVILMAMGNLSKIVTQLMHHGRSPKTPIALIEWGSHPFQHSISGILENIVKKAATETIHPPVVVVVGEVVSLQKHFNWFESHPLFGKRILVTRAREQAAEFLDLLTAYGAEAISFPTLQIVPPTEWDGVDAAIDQIAQYDCLIFTSVNGVTFFRKRLELLRKDLRSLNGISLCAIGPRTAKAIEDWGMQVSLCPEEFKAEGLLKALGTRGIRGKRFLIPRAKEAREILPEEIKRLGGEVDVVSVYQAIRPDYGPEEIETLQDRGQIDMLTFASSSTLRNFIEIFGKKGIQNTFKESAIACIGPITAQTAEEHGLRVDIMPGEYTFSALADKIVDYFIKKR